MADTTIDDYIQTHIETRQKMIAARYPNISDEDTTIEFMISGLRRTSTLQQVIGPLLVAKQKNRHPFPLKLLGTMTNMDEGIKAVHAVHIVESQTIHAAYHPAKYHAAFRPHSAYPRFILNKNFRTADTPNTTP